MCVGVRGCVVCVVISVFHMTYWHRWRKGWDYRAEAPLDSISAL